MELQNDATATRTDQIIKRVMLSQLLFVAGNSLTVGGFFNFFVSRFDPSAFMLAAAMIVPETSQSFSVLGHWIVHRFPSRKWNWIFFLTVGRIAAMLLPIAWLIQELDSPLFSPVIFILICTAIWYLSQGIAYVNYISWLSDLVPEIHWGKLLSRRQIAGLVVALGLPVVVAQLRANYLKGLPPAAEAWSYSIIFLIGGTLCLTSILPMLRLEDVPWRRLDKHLAARDSIRPRRGGFPRSLMLLVGARWWLAFFQGLTQAVLFKYATQQLKIDLPTYAMLGSVLVLAQIPVAAWAGRLCDRGREKWTLFWGIIALSFAMLFWIMATPETVYLIWIAYFIWGGFGLLNVCGPSLCLKLSPTSDNTTQFALYDQCAGLIAGMAGILGGLWLDQLIRNQGPGSSSGLSPFVLLFAISMVGRFLACFWVLGIQQPKPKHMGETH